MSVVDLYYHHGGGVAAGSRWRGQYRGFTPAGSGIFGGKYDIYAFRKYMHTLL